MFTRAEYFLGKRKSSGIGSFWGHATVVRAAETMHAHGTADLFRVYYVGDDVFGIFSPHRHVSRRIGLTALHAGHVQAAVCGMLPPNVLLPPELASLFVFMNDLTKLGFRLYGISL